MAGTTALVHDSPEAKARIKEIKAEEATLKAEWLADREAGLPWSRERADRARSLQYERLALQTTPLPVVAWDLPARMLSADESRAAILGPQDRTAYTAGDLVVIYSRGGWREAIVVKTHPTTLDVAYTTATAVREAKERSGNPVVTRKSIRIRDTYNHRPIGRQAELAAAAAELGIDLRTPETDKAELIEAARELGIDLEATSDAGRKNRTATPEEETMTDVTPDPKPAKKTPAEKKAANAARMRERRQAAKDAEHARLAPARQAAAAVLRGVEVTPVADEVAPVVELPASDTPRVAGSELAASFTSLLREQVPALAEKAAANSPYSTLSVDGKPIGYVNVNKAGIRVEARQADGTKVGYKATSSDDFQVALDALVARASAVTAEAAVVA